MAKATKATATKATAKGRKAVKGAIGKGSVKAKGKAGKANAKATVVRERPLLTKREATILGALAKSKRGMTRGQLIDATGITKGYALIMGTIEAPEANTLVGRGLVKYDEVEGERSIMCMVTATGRQTLERFTKAARAK